MEQTDVMGVTEEQAGEVYTFDEGDRVHIVVPPHKENEVEAFYYLSDFTEKRGVITGVKPEPVLIYEVEVGGRTAIVYHDELRLGWVK